MANLFLAFLGLVSVLSAAGVVFSRNAVHSALCLTVNLMVVAVLFLTLSQQFLGVAQIMIYAGAIMVVFLFAVTVLAPDEEVTLKMSDTSWLSGVLFGLAIMGLLVAAVTTRALPAGGGAAPPNGVEQFATLLFGRYVFPFEGTAFVLLVALIGAVLLGHRRLRG